MEFGAHARAEELAVQAASCLGRGDQNAALSHYSDAADEELSAWRSVSAAKPRSYSALALSAIALLYKARRYEDCERISLEVLSGHALEPYAREEIQQLRAVSREETPRLATLPAVRRLDRATLQSDPEAVWHVLKRGDSVIVTHDGVATEMLTRGAREGGPSITWEEYVARSGAISFGIEPRQGIIARRGNDFVSVSPADALAPPGATPREVVEHVETIESEGEWLVGPTNPVKDESVPGHLTVRL